MDETTVATATDTETTAEGEALVEDVLVDELLVEEIPIHGMCSVY